MRSHPPSQRPQSAYALASRPLFTKYMAWLALLSPALQQPQPGQRVVFAQQHAARGANCGVASSCGARLLCPLPSCRVGIAVMRLHASQFVWYRQFYVRPSRCLTTPSSIGTDVLAPLQVRLSCYMWLNEYDAIQ